MYVNHSQCLTITIRHTYTHTHTMLSLPELFPYPKCRGESSCRCRTSWGQHRPSLRASPPYHCSEDSCGGRWSAVCSPRRTCLAQTWWYREFGHGTAPTVQIRVKFKDQIFSLFSYGHILLLPPHIQTRQRRSKMLWMIWILFLILS